MGRICRVPGCQSNFPDSRAKNQVLKLKNDIKNAGRKNINTFGFPSALKEPDEREKWIQAIPRLNKLLVDNMKKPSVCEKHWPANFEVIRSRNGKVRPKYPPSIFKGFQPSEIPTPPPPPRTTNKSSFEVRTRVEDELPAFLDADKVTFETLQSKVTSHKFCAPVLSFETENVVWIQAAEFTSGIPCFAIKIFRDLTFEAFHSGARVHITSLSKNRISRLDKWSRVEEAVRFLKNSEMTQHQKVIKQQIETMNVKKVGEKTYSPEVIVRAYEYYATSRTTYNRLRNDLKLPSVRVLQNITSKVNNLSDKKFIDEIFSNVSDKQKECVVMVDEVYVKKYQSYHGGKLFGRAMNSRKKLANAVLGIMIKCLHGGPEFLIKMIPVRGMKAKFLYEQVQEILKLIRGAGGKPTSIIGDGCRVNKKFFKKFKTVDKKPWLTTDGIFLLFDYVHLIKCIRNNWLTEPNGEIKFEKDGTSYTAKWDDLLNLFELEEAEREVGSGIRGLSKLTEVSVKPKPIERQRVETCLRVFSEETLHALKTHPKLNQESVKGTIMFIEEVLN